MTFVFLSEDGVNPQEIIDIIARDSSQGIFKKVFEDIAGNINQGYSLAEAFDETNFFPPDFIAVLRVGETSGKLSSALRRYLEHIKQVIKMDRSFNNSINYPLFLVNVFFFFSVFSFVYIAPRIQEMIKMSGSAGALPIHTKFLLFMHDVIMAGGYPGVAVLIALFLFCMLSGRTRRLVMFAVGKIGRVKKLKEDLEWARWLTMAGICLHAGMNTQEMIEQMGKGPLPKELAGNNYERIKFKVLLDGQKISDQFKEAGVNPTLVTLISISEHTGRLEDIFTSRGNQIMEAINANIDTVKSAINNAATLVIMFATGIVILASFGSMITMTTMI